MQAHKYIYSFRYDHTESNLSKLESWYLFNKQESHKQLFSNIEIDPSKSAFIKSRLDITTSSDNYEDLIDQIKKKEIMTDGFKVEYLILEGDETRNKERLGKLKDVGYSINTFPDYYNPTITYGLCSFENIWYFGILNKNNFIWQKHKQKPFSYSNSIKQNIAKALVNIAASTKRNPKLLDACCGVGTIMLEACFTGYSIEGCDISWKTCNNARANLAHYDYAAEVHHADIKDLDKQDDAAIIDLPYNIYSPASDMDISNIIKATTEITNRLVIVSTAEIGDAIENAGLTVLDYCDVSKRGKANFTRKVWVCETRN